MARWSWRVCVGDDEPESDDKPSRVWGLKRSVRMDVPSAAAAAVLAEHDGLLRFMMQRYKLPRGASGISVEDQYQIGQCVLLQAHATFDPSVGVVFSTWAVRLLKQSFVELARRSRLQSRKEQILVLRARDGEDLTPAERDTVRQLETRVLVSLAAPTGEDRTLEDCLPAENADGDEIAHRQDREWFYAKLATLTAQERSVIEGYLSDRTFREIGASIGVTRQRAQQVYADALAKLRLAADRDKRRM